MNIRINILSFICFILLFLVVGCTQEVPVSNNKPVVTTNPTQKSKPIPPPVQNKPTIQGLVEQPKDSIIGQQKGIVAQKPVAAIYVECKTSNKTLPENILRLPMKNISAFIGANESTNDKDLGESHRVFEVKSGPLCELLFSQTLPVNVSVDFPYYLSEEAANEKLGLIGIRGFHDANVFDINAKKLFSNLKPKFLTKREAADATSGMISHLFFDENFLYGYAVDFGVFAFDMKQNGSPLLPIAEFAETQLFGLNRGNNQVDIMIPIVTFDENGTLDLKLKNIFERTVTINPALKFKFQNGKYILFKEKMGASPTNHLVVNMEKKERLNLPKEIAESSIQKVMDYLK